MSWLVFSFFIIAKKRTFFWECVSPELKDINPVIGAVYRISPDTPGNQAWQILIIVNLISSKAA
jgi:hypothetical protein